jgi:isoquinoline 1-oxidoreductase alpha subunit
MKLTINGVDHEIDVEPQMPLLWVLREELQLYGTRFGCGRGLCGACTVHVDGQAVRSCIRPVSTVEGTQITTIEGLGSPESPHPVQAQWLAHAVPQCGYCQSGMIMAAAAFLDGRPTSDDGGAPEPVTDEQVCRAVTNVCRCGCYERIRQAVVDASKAAS